MTLTELLPKKNKDWFSAIFEIAESKINIEEKNIENKIYVVSEFYQTSMLEVSHYYKPVII